MVEEVFLKLSEMLDVKKLREHILMGVVSEMFNHDHPYVAIYNYTHVAQHDNIWDDVTEQCRGLIVDTISDEVLARPFRKFFNLNTSFRPETMEDNLPTQKPRILEKLDGSLGIFYEKHGKVAIATRGSFHSDQAKWATRWYAENMGKHSWPEGYTPLFEIIYKENRIVVSYEFEGLVLLGLVNISTGFELSPEEVESWARRNGLRSAREYSKTLSECKSETTPNVEGYVLQYWNTKAPIPLRIKVKTEDYVRLHKVITGLNPKGIWEHLSKGNAPEALWYPASHNQQFTSWCVGWINTFRKLYDEIESEAIKAFGHASIEAHRGLAKEQSQLDTRGTRKYYALAFQKETSSLAPVLFAMLDGRDYQPAIWAQLEPKIQGKEVYIRDADTNNGI
jgi:RNA ligase